MPVQKIVPGYKYRRYKYRNFHALGLCQMRRALAGEVFWLHRFIKLVIDRTSVRYGESTVRHGKRYGRTVPLTALQNRTVPF